MSRKLASVQRIVSLEPIPDRDRIELATILGWKVIVAKGEYQVGDLVVYCEPDSLLPPRPEFEFLRSRCYLPKYNVFRIKTMKMGNVFSQGIVFPLEILRGVVDPASISEGMDVTTELGVAQWYPQESQEHYEDEAPQPKERRPWLCRMLRQLGVVRRKKSRNTFPPEIYKTDETRLQAIPKILDQMRGYVLCATEKLDGCSATYFARRVRRNRLLELLFGQHYEFGVCSRNNRIAPNGSHYWEVARAYRLPEKLLAFAREFQVDVAVQGEIVGPRIQGNHYRLPRYMFFVYQVQFPRQGEFLSWPEIRMFCGKLGLDTVPEVDLPEDHYHSWGVDEWLAFAQGQTVVGNAESPREGIVVRTKEDYRGTDLPTVANRLSFKAINREYLIKYDQ